MQQEALKNEGPPRHCRVRNALEQLLRLIVEDRVTGEARVHLYCSNGGIRDVKIHVAREVPIE